MTSTKNGSGRAMAQDPLPAIRAGLIGRGIQKSRTPGMHEAEGARLGLDYRYRLLDFDHMGLQDSDLPAIVEKARAEGYRGLNITYPFKERVIACLDRLSDDARSIGAVNTVVFEAGEATGYNTDCWGFGESFRRGLDEPRLDRVVLIGAGGAGMAVGKALLDVGVRHLVIADRDSDKAASLIASLGERCGHDRVSHTDNVGAAIARADGIVNATPVGMDKYPGMSVKPEDLRSDLWVADVVYFPEETELLRQARALGCQVLPGSGMAIFQAVIAFRLMTGVEPDPEQMAGHFRALRRDGGMRIDINELFRP
ncbi:Quinate/shikimate dehydrogenase [Hartmannibacter diazotrophicus]|uniref:Shikimate dehydrogenase (NADP(+)) n=1 Tax=Hartmannibacter diazotrophicus TaxID=1482074 RepID=A0A2C9D5U9_9HYPH|nr:shikimate dehydrogenase [Hartmannibacter diazotrophicus]SON55676.1 Quinate/shikimate dehydrogenase [Hartmannibacter diazotrophicus]